jgi:hypothetical protein
MMGKGDNDVRVVWEGDGGWFKARVEERVIYPNA